MLGLPDCAAFSRERNMARRAGSVNSSSFGMTQLSSTPIPAAGSESSGASYEFVDRRIIGRAYYLLTAIGPTGDEQDFEPIEVRGFGERNPRRPPAASGGGP